MRILHILYFSAIALFTPMYSTFNIISTLKEQYSATEISTYLAITYGIYKASETATDNTGWLPLNMRNVVATGVAASVGYLTNTLLGTDAGIFAATTSGIGVKAALDYFCKERVKNKVKVVTSLYLNSIEPKSTAEDITYSSYSLPSPKNLYTPAPEPLPRISLKRIENKHQFSETRYEETEVTQYRPLFSKLVTFLKSLSLNSKKD